MSALVYEPRGRGGVAASGSGGGASRGGGSGSAPGEPGGSGGGCSSASPSISRPCQTGAFIPVGQSRYRRTVSSELPARSLLTQLPAVARAFTRVPFSRNDSLCNRFLPPSRRTVRLRSSTTPRQHALLRPLAPPILCGCFSVQAPLASRSASAHPSAYERLLCRLPVEIAISSSRKQRAKSVLFHIRLYKKILKIAKTISIPCVPNIAHKCTMHVIRIDGVDTYTRQLDRSPFLNTSIRAGREELTEKYSWRNAAADVLQLFARIIPEIAVVPHGETHSRSHRLGQI
eukprot:COSAG02_NODE_10_length_59045_cov_19.973365_26_plen_288_part_00